jgi:hypothetical protein
MDVPVIGLLAANWQVLGSGRIGDSGAIYLSYGYLYTGWMRAYTVNSASLRRCRQKHT